MDEIKPKTDVLTTGKPYCGAEAPYPRPQLERLLADYGIEPPGEIRLIDSSRAEDDIRLNYVVDRAYVLRICNAPDMSEKRISELDRLVWRYRELGMICPAFVDDPEGAFIHELDGFSVYLSEYADLPLAAELDLPEPELERLMDEARLLEARFAARFADTELSETMGMYSLFELSPFDKPNGVDEKQFNFDSLMADLAAAGKQELGLKLKKRHEAVRAALLENYHYLPRCVFQGDENPSNLLVGEDGRLAGLIDFNLAGTDVVVNQLANIAGAEFDSLPAKLGPKPMLDAAIARYRENAARMLKEYRASGAERRAMALCGWIVFIAQWPNYLYFSRSLKTADTAESTAELLDLIADLPEESLFV